MDIVMIIVVSQRRLLSRLFHITTLIVPNLRGGATHIDLDLNGGIVTDTVGRQETKIVQIHAGEDEILMIGRDKVSVLKVQFDLSDRHVAFVGRDGHVISPTGDFCARP